MDGGGTSSSTPQIAAACALWLKQHGAQFPAGWQRVDPGPRWYMLRYGWPGTDAPPLG